MNVLFSSIDELEKRKQKTAEPPIIIIIIIKSGKTS